MDINGYDAVSDVVESGVHWRSDFQIGSRVLKICFKPILMHIYGMQYDFMHRSCWNHSNFENSWFYNVISTSDPQNHCLLGSRNRVAVNFFNRYVIYWVVPCERARPELSEYVWQRGVGSLEGRVTAGRSWPFFQKKEKAGGRRNKKSYGFPKFFHAKSSRENFRNVIWKLLSGGYGLKKFWEAVTFFVTPPYFCWQITFCRPRPTSGRNNTDKNVSPTPLIHIFWTVSA